MNSILRRCTEEPVGLTYLAIGSCPYPTPEYPLTPKNDQLFPLCFHERVGTDKQPMRLLHFDPGFERSQEVLTRYWSDLKLTRIDCEGGDHWISDTLDVLLVSDRISQPEHLWFFESLVEILLATKGKLVIQDYTGASLTDLAQKLYASSTQKELFKRRVLLDMSYGTDWGCSTDLSTVNPFYDFAGNFLPIQWMSPSELKPWCGTTPKLDTILFKRTQNQYLESLNRIHVDYRRKRQGLPLLYGSPDYTNESSGKEILTVLERTLLPLADLLQTLRKVSPELVMKFRDLFERAETEDMYKWYDAVSGLVKI